MLHASRVATRACPARYRTAQGSRAANRYDGGGYARNPTVNALTVLALPLPSGVR
jgi:hypothetical protein